MEAELFGPSEQGGQWEMRVVRQTGVRAWSRGRVWEHPFGVCALSQGLLGRAGREHAFLPQDPSSAERPAGHHASKPCCSQKLQCLLDV